MPTLKNLFAHYQLNTGDPSRAKKFYKALFAWKFEELKMAPGMTYTAFDTGSRESGGGMQTPEDFDGKAAWVNYVQVADVKKCIAKAAKLGAQVVVEYQPIPDMGGFGIFIDPTGAMLGVWEPEKKAVRKPRKTKRAAKR